MPKYIVGLDIGSSSIKAAMCTENENGDFEVIDYAYVESKGINKGRVSNSEDAILAIRECINTLKIVTGKNITDVYLGISSEGCKVINSKGHTYVDGIDSKVTKQHIENAYLDAKEIILENDEEIIDCIIDYFETDNWEYKNIKNPLGIQCSVLTINLNLIITKKNTLDFLKQVICSAGYNFKGVFLSVDCLKNIFLSEKTESSNVAIVDIGAEKTDIAIYEKNKLKEIAFIPLGGNNITKDLAICLSIDSTLAEEVKESYSHKFSTPSNGIIKVNESTFDILLVHDIIEARLLEIIDYINENIIDENFSGDIEKIIITGDGIAYYENIEYIMKEKIGKNVKVFTKNHFSFEKSSIITPISIVKETHDRLKLICDEQALWSKKVIIDDNSNKSKNVKKRGFSRVKAFLDEIF